VAGHEVADPSLGNPWLIQGFHRSASLIFSNRRRISSDFMQEWLFSPEITTQYLPIQLDILEWLSLSAYSVRYDNKAIDWQFCNSARQSPSRTRIGFLPQSSLVGGMHFASIEPALFQTGTCPT
jgi:hypothetical protein